MQVKGETGNGTACNYYVSALYHQAVHIGLDIDSLLEKVNISKNVIDKPNIRIKTESLSALQKACWEESKSESLGLKSVKLKLGTYYMMGQLTVHQPTLQNAITLGAKFYNLITGFKFITVDIGKETCVISFNRVTPEEDYAHLFAEMCLLAWHRYASWLIADTIPLFETRFNYPRPKHAGEYSYLFPGMHRFDCRSLSLVFPSQYLSRPIKQNEALLTSFMNNCPLELFRQYKADYSVSTEVRNFLKNSINDGSGSIEEVASHLHMTSRTMMRRLKEEGASFQQIKDVVRRDKAISLLTLHLLPIKEIAERVGFSDPAVFARAFKKWTGNSPRSYREKFNYDNDKIEG